MRRPLIIMAVLVTIAAILLLLPRHQWQTHSSLHRYEGVASSSIGSRVRVSRQKEDEENLTTGKLSGTVLDDFGNPVHAVEVDLIPLKPGQRGATEWTDSKGRYEFRAVNPGEYELAVLHDGAPTSQQPFQTSYYPGGPQSSANRITVVAAQSLSLHAIVLQRVPLAKINVHVRWSDGSPAQGTSLLFYNPSFPNQGVIGNESIGLANADEQIEIPSGFDYYARVVVQCDAGRLIESRESRPVQKIRVDTDSPSDLNFVIVGPCKRWQPN